MFKNKYNLKIIYNRKLFRCRCQGKCT